MNFIGVFSLFVSSQAFFFRSPPRRQVVEKKDKSDDAQLERQKEFEEFVRQMKMMMMKNPEKPVKSRHMYISPLF
ncbi:Oidioi.mRNA.OKI2018_I69.chr2.g4590.t1.cds [Oikopleura dioica]|uniref:Oidioi.mRNA.OKI2018_I69.chr2.g4590.t1.cds n=1 Tax=Oikopleura dioica TaxID=34765 RepID=A0ABN7T4B8_OIKDI|nr:Oidioi.mRNA.OKI2018_I69.chr2.g4590.t1.cds [Oikopleura dioica]